MTRAASSNEPSRSPAAGPQTRAPGARRAAGVGREFWETLGGTALSVLLFSLIFPQRSIWPLTFLCLTPWTVVICRAQRAWLAHWFSFLGGFVFFIVNLRWLMPVTGLGFAALAFYLGIYWTLAAWAIRTARRFGIGPTLSLPIAWIATEYLRGWVMSGFPWLFLGHALYQQTVLIQIGDLTGAYGVSFLAGLSNGWLAELTLRGWRGPAARSGRSVAAGAAALLAAFGFALGYGYFRLRDADFRDGPRIAVIQEDFPLVSTPPYGDPYSVVFSRYLSLASRAVAERPDLLVFPETVWVGAQNVEFVEMPPETVHESLAAVRQVGKFSHDATAAFARGDYATVNRMIARLGARSRGSAADVGDELPRLAEQNAFPVTVVLGAVSMVLESQGAEPTYKRFNSAFVYDQDGTQRRQRYDKTHLVPFGEAVPFRNTRLAGMSLHWLYRWLNQLSPFSDGGKIEYSLWPGDEYTIFTLPTASGELRFGVPICYEDVMPEVVRQFVWAGGQRRADFLLNISNDGWFLHSDELPQHLAICVFRAVENRVGIARAVNTGISGFIDPAGRVYGAVERDGRRVGPGVIGYSVQPIKLDARDSVYGRSGDWFAGACLLASLPAWLGGIVTRWLAGLRNLVLKPRPPRAAGG